MRTVFVFDDYLMVKKIPSLFGIDDTVYLFPLTSKSSITTAIMDKIKSGGCNIRLLQSARLINTSAENLRGEYMRFIADFPERVQSKGRNLKEIFAVDRYVSLWWFSLISEKNTFKSDSFNRFAQLDSIVHVIKREKIDKIIFGCGSEKLKNALYEYSCKSHIKLKVLPTKPIRKLKMRIRQSQNLLYLKHNIILICFVIREYVKTQAIKRQIASLKRTIPQNGKSLLFFTPYPNIDKSLAESAIFKDRSYIHLQSALENSNRDIIWIAMYANYSAFTFKESLEYVKRFIKNGYTIFPLEEFNSLSKQIKALLVILKSGFKFLKLERSIYRAHNFRNYNIYPLFKDDWYSSFTGKKGYWGVMNYYLFKRILKKLKTEKCLYLCEMQEWEKALISARNSLRIETSLYGYQSGTISKMLLNLFNHPSEVSNGGSYAMPQPDKIACNGKLPYIYMRESGWPEERVLVVEAIKYNHLKKYINQKWNKKKDTVLLALSISPEESSSILNLAYEAFKDRKDIEVWLRPHPALRLKNVFELSGISLKNCPFKIKNGKLEDILSKTKVVVAGESGVSIEAIAYGCSVVIVEVPEWINMSPLKGMHTEMVKSANSPQSLREVIFNIFREEYDLEKRAAEARKIINNFFCLNQETDIPENFLKLLISSGRQTNSKKLKHSSNIMAKNG